jgi:DHA1 family bicyclomycin/chloramphenicol resistance-like MFS transporter
VGLGMVFPNLLSGAIAPFPAFAGAASSTSGFLQMLVSSVIGAVVLQFYDGTQLAMTAGILFAVAAMAGVYYALVWRRLNATGSR